MQATKADVLVYAATPSGIAAAIEAGHLGKSVILLEPGQHVGGMTSSGLGTTDIYGPNNGAGIVGGFTQQFFAQIRSIYGSGVSADVNGAHYEPHVAEQAFTDLLAKESGVTVVLGATLSSVNKQGATICSVATSSQTYQAKEYIDASYEGDLMASAGVSYTVGRESATQYSESYAGTGMLVPMGNVNVDPYVTPGDSASGLLPHVLPDTLAQPTGSADKSVQAYDYRLCVTPDTTNQIPFSAPAGYDPAEFEGLGRYAVALVASGLPYDMYNFLSPGPLPNNKIDINSGGPFSTDDIDAGAGYPDAAPTQRTAITAEIKRYNQALIYFLITDPRIPAKVQTQIRSWGLCKDEFTDNGGWPRQLYVREARRMVGNYVITEGDVLGTRAVQNSIGVGGWVFDCHGTNRMANSGMIEDEQFLGANEPRHYYPISYDALIPQSGEATNLFVTVDVSASHVAYTSLRVEPTYMIMGQAAGAAASIAIDKGISTQSIPYPTLSSQLISDGAVLNPPAQ